MQFDSLDFFKEHARRYSQLSHELANSAYTDPSHPSLKGDTCMLNPVIELAPCKRCPYAG